MDIWKKYKSPLGYYNNDNQIDSYGVDHSGFSTRDELNYQMARQQKEDTMLQQYNNQGITSNYPQYTTNFWGQSADNNYGFGNSDIEGNVEKMKSSSLNIRNPITSLYNAGHKIGELAADAKIAYDYLQKTL